MLTVCYVSPAREKENNAIQYQGALKKVARIFKLATFIRICVPYTFIEV